MARRIIEADGARWSVAPAGQTTQYGRDEFALVFRRLSGDGTPGEARMIRYSPRGTRMRELSLAAMDDHTLREMLGRSQPGWTAPELGYRR
jgi:hypothetical protein